jgi:hypothetical protein
MHEHDWKDNQIYFHLQQAICHLGFPLKSNGHLTRCYQLRPKGLRGFPEETSIFTLFILLREKLI